MAKVITDNQHYSAIAEAIRTKNETDTLYKPSEMAAAILEIQGGGADLNFEIVGGTTQPENPKENTIWVSTEQEITGWIFSATEPESPDTDMVWFETSKYSTAEFNALKENGITVYPISAKQYVSGAWAAVFANVYKNGAWVGVDKGLLLYRSGNEYPSITGGWISKNDTSNGSYPYSGILHKLNDCMRVETGNQTSLAIATANPIDLTVYDTFTVKIKEGSALPYNCVFANIDTNYAAPGTTVTAFKEYTSNITLTEDTEMSLDVSDLKGMFYVGYKYWQWGGSNNEFSILEVKLA